MLLVACVERSPCLTLLCLLWGEGVCVSVSATCIKSPCTPAPPSLAGLGGWRWTGRREKSKDGVDVCGLCPLQRMSHPGGCPALSSWSLLPHQAVMGFPAWTPRRAVSTEVGSGSDWSRSVAVSVPLRNSPLQCLPPILGSQPSLLCY